MRTQRVKRAKKNAPIESLPENCMWKIARLLSRNANRLTLQVLAYRLICRNWNMIFVNAVIALNIRTKRGYDLIKKFPNVRTLILRIEPPKEWCIPTAIKIKRMHMICIHLSLCAELFRNLQALRHLEWIGNEETYNKCPRSAFDLLIARSQLRSLRLIGKDGCCTYCIPMYAQFIHLQKFELFECTKIDARIVRNVCTLPKLTHITLQKVQFIHPGLSWEDLTEWFNESPGLKSATLSYDIGNPPLVLYISNQHEYMETRVPKIKITWTP